MQQMAVEHERDHEPERERTERHEDARAELIEVLDERRFLTVAEAPR